MVDTPFVQQRKPSRFQKVVTVLQNSTGTDYDSSNPVPTKLLNDDGNAIRRR